MKAYEIIQAGWCQETFATTPSGQDCGILYSGASNFCLVGAVCKSKNLSWPCWNDPKHPEFEKLQEATGGMVGTWNDTHTKEECVELLRKLDL